MGVAWFGAENGYQRFLIGFSLSKVGVGDKTEANRAQVSQRGAMPSTPYQLPFVAEIA
jgi:hypothetical protein